MKMHASQSVPLQSQSHPHFTDLKNALTEHSKIAILGAGLLGRMLAVLLSKPELNTQVHLFDKDTEQGTQSAAYLAAAMLAPIAESAEASADIMHMGENALKLWPEFLAQLEEPVFFQQTGTIVLAHESDKSYLFDFKRRLKKQENACVQTLNAHQLEQLEPAFEKQRKGFTENLFLPTEGQLDNRQLLKSMASALKKRQLNWQTETTLDFSEHPERLKQLKEEFDWVIDCRGLGAKEAIPTTQELRGVRGEVIRVRAPDVNITRPVRLMHPRYPIYIAPKEQHIFVIGATQIESQDQRQPTVRSALELLSSCFSVHPGFAEAEVLEMRAGLRPAFIDNEPKIFKDNNFISINGLYRHGYLLAPSLAEQCLKILKSASSQATLTTNQDVNHTANHNAKPSVNEVATYG